MTTFPTTPVLSLSWYAFRKLEFLKRAVATEIGCMGVAYTPDPLLVTDLMIPRQTVDYALTTFDPESYADLTTDLVVDGVAPSHCQRVWIHTHPSGLTEPSGLDLNTFESAFGPHRCEWACMVIAAKQNIPRAWLRYPVTQGGRIVEIPVATPPTHLVSESALLHEGWSREIRAAISSPIWSGAVS